MSPTFEPNKNNLNKELQQNESRVNERLAQLRSQATMHPAIPSSDQEHKIQKVAEELNSGWAFSTAIPERMKLAAEILAEVHVIGGLNLWAVAQAADGRVESQKFLNKNDLNLLLKHQLGTLIIPQTFKPGQALSSSVSDHPEELRRLIEATAHSNGIALEMIDGRLHQSRLPPQHLSNFGSEIYLEEVAAHYPEVMSAVLNNTDAGGVLPVIKIPESLKGIYTGIEVTEYPSDQMDSARISMTTRSGESTVLAAFWKGDRPHPMSPEVAHMRPTANTHYLPGGVGAAWVTAAQLEIAYGLTRGIESGLSNDHTTRNYSDHFTQDLFIVSTYDKANLLANRDNVTDSTCKVTYHRSGEQLTNHLCENKTENQVVVVDKNGWDAYLVVDTSSKTVTEQSMSNSDHSKHAEMLKVKDQLAKELFNILPAQELAREQPTRQQENKSERDDDYSPSF